VSPFRGALTLSRLSRYLCLGRVSVSFSRYLTVLTVGLRSLPNQALTVINLRGVLVWHLTPHSRQALLVAAVGSFWLISSGT
jgi:hypothetical protein